MSSTTTNLPEGSCGCGHIRYRLTTTPLFIHCCHCTVCQAETGTAFALNALIEASAVTLLSGSPTAIRTPSESGKGQLVSRCPQCHVAVWSNYAGAGPSINFIRVGTLDPDIKKSLSPDVHIYTKSKLSWVVIPEGAKQMDEFYDVQEHWPEESFQRFMALKPESDKWKADGGSFSP